MNSFEQLYLVMKDGTIKQKNPFTGTEVWYVPGRDSRPIGNKSEEEKKIEITDNKENEHCVFCPKNYLETTPEKSRLILENNNNYSLINKIDIENLFKNNVKFRRISNLFEIVTYDYWEKNYNYKLSKENQKWKNNYLSSEKGRNHIKHILKNKFKSMKWSIKDIENLIKNKDKLYKYSNPFFGGSHELIISTKHYKDNAKYNTDLCSSGELTPEEHFHYYKFTIDAIKNILRNNRYVRYVTVFQNWLNAAGASLEHLHRQLVGLDEWSSSIEKEIIELRKNRNLYNEYGPNFAIFHDLIFAENDYAVAYADYGHRYPTIAIYSKSVNPRPYEHSDEEIKGISDIVHAVHRAMGSDIACNEEWYYTPVDAVDFMPFYVLIKWRTVTPAGFEGSTKIYINPISPIQLRDALVPKLYELRNEGKLGNIKIAEECSVRYNMLQYYKYQK